MATTAVDFAAVTTGLETAAAAAGLSTVTGAGAAAGLCFAGFTGADDFNACFAEAETGSGSSVSSSSSSESASSAISKSKSTFGSFRPRSISSSSTPRSSRSSSSSEASSPSSSSSNACSFTLASPRLARGLLMVTCGGGAGGECGSRKARISSGVVSRPSINSRNTAFTTSRYAASSGVMRISCRIRCGSR